MQKVTLIVFVMVLGLGGCGDDDGSIGDTGSSADSTVGDATVMDAAPDATVEAGADGSVDAPSDGSSDATPGDAALDASGDTSLDASDAATDATLDAPPDAPPDVPVETCGALPACASDEVCWGEGCNCITEIDGDSYLRTDGTPMYAQLSMHLAAETAPGVALTGVVEIMDGWRHTCGLLTDGTVSCWAKATTGNAFGELGSGTIGGVTTPMRASQVLVSAGAPLTGISHLGNRSSSRCYIESTTCGIRGTDGALFCWGVDNAGGGTGSLYTEGTVGSRPFATQIMADATTPLLGVTQVAVGLRHACAITTGGSLSCWGMNVTGSLGLGDQIERRYPTAVTLPGGATADQIGVGADFSCARSGDRVFCWGASALGQVGLGDPTAPGSHDGCINFCKLTPVSVIDTADLALTGVVDLEVHYQGACGRMADHTLRCWGLGAGNRATPLVIGAASVTDVAEMTSCGTDSITSVIRYLGRDGTLNRASGPVAVTCP